jgi:hypothetical protein
MRTIVSGQGGAVWQKTDVTFGPVVSVRLFAMMDCGRSPN